MLSKAEIKYFNECASEILSSEKVQLMRTFPHHGNVSCLEHSLSVAYYSYLLCKNCTYVLIFKVLLEELYYTTFSL